MAIETILEALNSRFNEITDLIPDIYYFYDEPGDGAGSIDDGGNDMYDSGNIISTNYSESVPYTHTQAENNESEGYTNPTADGQIVSGSGYFGSNSNYFTNMYPGLFVLVATDCDISEFSINGNVGSDGEGTISVNNFNVTVGNEVFTVFTKFSGETDDPSVNHLIIVPGDRSENINRDYSEDSDDDLDKISSEEPFETIYYLLVARRLNENGDRLTNEIALDVATAFINIVSGPQYTFEVVVYNLSEVISTCLPDTLEHILYGLNHATVLISDGNLGRRILKHGDQFTVSGTQAAYLKEIFVDVASPLLKIV